MPDPASGVDLSEFQDPHQMQYSAFGFAIIRASHGFTEDRQWRAHTWCMGVVHRPFGFYHALESNDVEGEATYFRNLIANVAHTRGEWLDIARGDLNSTLISTSTVDRFRSVIDTGIYVNLSALDSMPEYKRFERLWVADLSASPPGRWLMWQKGQGFGVDIDVTADLGGEVRANWIDYSFPNP